MSLAEFNANNFNFTVYPNPSNSDFNLQFKEKPTQTYSISILDILGSQIYFEEVNDLEMNHVISTDLNKGLYVIQVAMEGEVYTHKVIKN